ncbi:MAG: hypothetical protein PWQ50_2300 [Methanolobus sp.]|nr:hypothetical protein [Methanolobus sp.]
MDDEICTMEKCDTEIMDTEVSQSSSRDYDMEISEDEQASDSRGTALRIQKDLFRQVPSPL